MRQFGFAPLLLVLLLLSCAATAVQPSPEPTATIELVPDTTPTDAASTDATPTEAGTPMAALGQPFELPIGGAVVIAETGTQVTFRAVQEDSRCPARVNCIWAGRVTVQLEAAAPSADAEAFTLASCCASDGRQHLYAGQTIDLVGVTPAPLSPDAPIPRTDYRAQLVVT